MIKYILIFISSLFIYSCCGSQTEYEFKSNPEIVYVDIIKQKLILELDISTDKTLLEDKIIFSNTINNDIIIFISQRYKVGDKLPVTIKAYGEDPAVCGYPNLQVYFRGKNLGKVRVDMSVIEHNQTNPTTKKKRSESL